MVGESHFVPTANAHLLPRHPTRACSDTQPIADALERLRKSGLLQWLNQVVERVRVERPHRERVYILSELDDSRVAAGVYYDRPKWFWKLHYAPNVKLQ